MYSWVRHARPLAAFGMLACLIGCAAVTQGTSQAVNIETSPAGGARCEARNNDGVWHVPSTPGQVTVSKSYSDLTVSCSHADGSKGTETVTSRTGASVFGNAILGGGVGIIVDVASGAAYEYPNRITVFTNAPELAGLVAGEWKTPRTGTRLKTSDGGFSVNAIDGETVSFVDAGGGTRRSLYGMIGLLPNARDVRLTAGALFPMKVGGEAVLSEVPSVGGAVLEHRVSVKSVEEVTLGNSKYKAFRLLDSVKVVGSSNVLQDEQRHIWYVPELGMAMRVRAETINGAAVAARSYEVVDVGPGG